MEKITPKLAIIPFISEREVCLDELGIQLESEGKRLFINELNWEKSYPYAPICTVDLAYTENSLLLHYFVRGLSLRTLSPADGNYVHVDSCVEFFMQQKEGNSYINFEFNAAGTSYSSHHKTIAESTPFTEQEYATIRRRATFAGEKLHRENELFQWELSLEIPWTTMKYAPGEIPESFRANFYKCADETDFPHYLSWSPIQEEKPAFHRPQFFGEIILAKQ